MIARAPRIEVKAKSLKLAWILRFFNNEKNYNESWKAIPNYFVMILIFYYNIITIKRC